MVGEDTFYEAAAERDVRFRDLVATVAVADPEWFGRFVLWLRKGALLRSASVVAALEGARAQVAAGVTGSRAVVDGALQGADEPGEALAYWTGRYGRSVPKPVKRGIADAATRLFHEKSLLKYDSETTAFRFGDVIDLTHPSAKDARQGDLFRYALDRRHKRDNPIPESLGVVHARAELMALPVEQRRAVTDPDVLATAGMTWEPWLGGDSPLWMLLRGSRLSRAWVTLRCFVICFARLAGGYNALICCGAEDDVGFIRTLIEKMTSKWNADPKRIYAFGISNGADMSYKLAVELSSTFAAVAPVSGGYSGQASLQATYVPKTPVSVIHFAGGNDRFYGAINTGLETWQQRLGCTPGTPSTVVANVTKTTAKCKGRQ